MILICPHCGTRYRLPDNRIGSAGREVKCVKCLKSWHQEQSVSKKNSEDLKVSHISDKESIGADGDAPNLNSIESSPQRILSSDSAGLAGSKVDRRGGAANIFGWIILVTLIVSLCFSGYFYREEVVNYWPPAGKLFRVFGLEIKRATIGLEITNIVHEGKLDGGQRVLLITGDILNSGTRAQEVPPIRIAVRDKQGRELMHAMGKAKKKQLKPGGVTNFSSIIMNPPSEGQKFSVTFVSGG